MTAILVWIRKLVPDDHRFFYIKWLDDVFEDDPIKYLKDMVNGNKVLKIYNKKLYEETWSIFKEMPIRAKWSDW